MATPVQRRRDQSGEGRTTSARVTTTAARAKSVVTRGPDTILVLRILLTVLLVSISKAGDRAFAASEV
jgi:hypothetical protein